MSVKIQLRDIQLSQLNSESLLLVSKFARVLKNHNGKVIRMSDKDVLLKISRCAKATRNEELKALYLELKEALIRSVYESTKLGV